jgi:hypothetical protein
MRFLTLRAACAPALRKQFRTATLLAFTLCAATAVLITGPGGHLLTPVKAATLTVCPSGCSATAINGAIALANSGDTIQVAAGTYNELVVVNKTNLILLGANSAILPCEGTRGPESIVGTANGAFQITANGVQVQGFLIQGVTGALGAGIHAVGVNSVRISNNIIQSNVIGVQIGGNLIRVITNSIRNNNNPGASSGTGVYSDTGLTNATIEGNCFTGHTRAATNLLGAPAVPGAVNAVAVTRNVATNDAAYAFFGGTNWQIHHNRSSGASNDALRFRGGVNGATVTNNQLTNGAAGGISVRNDLGGPNTNIQINCNRLVGFDKTAAIVVDPNANIGLLNPLATAAIIVDQGAYMGTLNAEGNFFGCNAGPNNAGCGTVIAFDNNLDFTPWSTLALTSFGDPNLIGRAARYAASLGGSPVMCGIETLPITFASTCGTPTLPTRPFPGEVWTTLTPTTAGACSISAMLDNQTVTLNQTILRVPTVTIGTPAGCIGPGSTVPVTFTMANPGTTPVTLSGDWNHTPGLLPLSNTCTANVPINCQPLGPSRLQFSGVVVPGGQTATITYQAQVGDVLPGTSLCIDTAFSINQSVAIPAVQACLTSNCAPAGPGALFPSSTEVSGQKAGSLLVYNLFSSSGSAPNTQNTRLSMTNTHATQPVAVHLFLVDGSSCSVADAFICLSQNQTASFLAADFDPGTTGYIVAIASDPVTGCPINFNYLIGDEFIKLASGHAANLPAESIAAIPGALPTCNDNSVTAQLNFNGVSYNRLPRVLADSNIPSRQDGNDTLLVINRIGGNLATGAATLGTLFGLLYDDAEAGFSFSLAGGCQLRGSFGATGFPRTVPPVNTIIPAGRTGWLKIYHQTEDIALLGAAINFNANAGTQSGAFNQGHNLHKLTLSSAATLTIPVFPPRC